MYFRNSALGGAPRHSQKGRRGGADFPGSYPSAPMTNSSAPFAKLSIFYPMWNEEEYVERALQAGRRACSVLVEAGDIADYEADHRRRRLNRWHCRNRRPDRGRRPTRPGRASRQEPQAG